MIDVISKIDDEDSKEVDDWTKEQIHAGVADTMLATNELPQLYSIAPTEGVPFSIFRDRYSEEPLAYPGIFLGHKRPSNEERLVTVHYSDICKSE